MLNFWFNRDSYNNDVEWSRWSKMNKLFDIEKSHAFASWHTVLSSTCITQAPPTLTGSHFNIPQDIVMSGNHQIG